MGIIDRHIIKGLLANYLIAIGVMISLYIVLDLFFNMDEFTESVSGTTDVMLDIVSFYGARVFLYFAQLSGVITLFACLITLARMRQQRELIAVPCVRRKPLQSSCASYGFWVGDHCHVVCGYRVDHSFDSAQTCQTAR